MQTKHIQFTKSIPDPVVTLRKAGNKTPLFLIHPVGGAVFYYLPLVQALTSDRPIYAIQDPGILTHDMLFSTLEEMCQFYVQVIMQYQPKGPYFIAGSSFGATAAVEIAKQLIAKNNTVKFIGLLDGWPVYPKSALTNRKWFEENLTKQMQSLHKIFDPKDIPQLFLDLHWHRQQMLAQYHVPNLSNLHLTLLKAQNTLPVLKPLDSKDNNWKKYSQSKPDVYIVPGDHFTMHFGDNAKALAKALDQGLEKADEYVKTK